MSFLEKINIDEGGAFILLRKASNKKYYEDFCFAGSLEK